MGNEEKNIKFIVCFLLFISSANAQFSKSLLEDSLPLFELGAGLIHLNVPAYPGSKGSKNVTIPFPAAVYRGKRMRADEDGGLYGKFIDSERYQLNFSFGGNFSSDADDSPERINMPKLDLLLELGPSFLVFIKKASPSSKSKITLTIPLRLAYSTDFKSLDPRGATFNPSIFYLRQNCLFENTYCYLGYDLKFATTDYMSYYYDVRAPFSNANRTEYKSKPGFLSTGAALVLSHTFKEKFSFFHGYFYNSYHYSVNLDSPLLSQKENTGFVVGFTYWFYESELKENSLF